MWAIIGAVYQTTNIIPVNFDNKPNTNLYGCASMYKSIALVGFSTNRIRVRIVGANY